MTGIKVLQNQYLEATDSAQKDKILSELYIEIIKLEKFLIQLKKLPNQIDDVYDLASNICMRLIEKQQPIIKTAPSQYLSNSLFYMNKTKFHDSLDDDSFIESNEPAVEKQIIYDMEMEELIRKLEEFLANYTSVSEQTKAAAMDCILSQIPYKKYSKELLEPEERKDFAHLMKDVKEFLISSIEEE